MRFIVGIELPTSPDIAFGIIVPVFETLGYGCATAVDTEADILIETKAVILDMAEEVLTDGLSLANLTQDLAHYQMQYPEFTQWQTVDIDIEMVTQ